MKHSIVVAVAAATWIVPTVAQEIPAAGFTALLCRLGVSGTGLYCAPNNTQLCLDVVDQAAGDNAGGTRVASVTVHHGKTNSSHQVTYTDDGDGVLDCGDSVVSVQ